MMFKKSVLALLLCVLVLAPFSAGCFLNKPKTPADTQVNAPPPDYTAIDEALKDPNYTVKHQALINLSAINHPETIPRLILVIQNNSSVPPLVKGAVKVLKNYKQDAVPLVKENLWNSDDPIVVDAAFQILSKTLTPQEFVPEVKAKYEVFKDLPVNTKFKIKLLTYYITNFDAPSAPDVPVDEKLKSESLVYILSLLETQDLKIRKKLEMLISAKRSTEIANILDDYFFNNLTNKDIQKSVLNILFSYDSPFGKIGKVYVPLENINPFLYVFGNYDPKLQAIAFQGLLKYGYNDADGKMMKFLDNFLNCSEPVVKANAMQLQRELAGRTQAPAGLVLPKFTVPEPIKRTDICVD